MLKYRTCLLLFGLLTIVSHSSAQRDENVQHIQVSANNIQTCSESQFQHQPLNEQTADFFSGIFSTIHWPPRWSCGNWSSFHGWFSIASDFTVWLSYFTIPGILFFFLQKKRVPKEFQRIFWLFIAFILCCGLTHLMEVIIFWWPAYRLNTVITFLTASVSVVTIISLAGALPASLNYKSPKELQSMIDDRTKLLKQKSDELEQVNKELKHFAYVMAHDLKAPLANIESLVGLLQYNEPVDNEEIFERLHKTIHKSKEKIEALNSVLEVRSIEGAKNANTNVQDTLNDTLLTIDELIKESKTVVHMDIDAQMTVPIPSVYLATVFQNLITNSIKYRKTNQHCIINIKGGTSNGENFIEVQDNGRGIDLSKYGKKFFGLFQRFHLDVEGKGVGLYITKNIVESFGGMIEIDSKVDQGSIFKLIFPNANESGETK